MSIEAIQSQSGPTQPIFSTWQGHPPFQPPAPKALYEALFLATKDLGPAPKDSKGNFGMYSSLDCVIAHTKPVLAAHDLMIIQAFSDDVLETALIHYKSGERIISHYRLVPEKNTPQGWGAAITYARRYCILALLGLASEDDPDSHPQSYNRPGIPPSHGTPKFTPKPQTQAGDTSSLLQQPIPIFKKYADKTYGQISMEELIGSVNWLKEDEKKNNKPMSANAAEFCNIVNMIRLSMDNDMSGFAQQSDEIPF